VKGKRVKAAFRRAAVLGGALVTAYVLLLLYPQPLFAYELEHAGIVLHATTPIPEAMRPTLAKVRERLNRTSVVDPADTYHVFICDSRWLFALFTRTNYQVGGVAHVYLGGRVFLRESDMENDRLIGPSGTPVAPDRPLSYFMAHEIMHVAHGRHLGLIAYTRLPRWVDDGHADYVARDIDFRTTLEAFKAGERALDPAKSGLYLRYHLMVAYELLKRGDTVESLLRHARRAEQVGGDLAALAAW
jgi:hypothetical protein